MHKIKLRLPKSLAFLFLFQTKDGLWEASTQSSDHIIVLDSELSRIGSQLLCINHVVNGNPTWMKMFSNDLKMYGVL